MPTNRRILSQDAAVSAAADSAQGLVLHLDANDEDSIESGGANVGNGSGTWFDIANHDLNVPLIDKASNLKLHLNASDTTSYGGSGTTWSDISGEDIHATTSGASFGSDIRGYFDFSGATSDLITIPDNDNFDMASNSTMEVWLTAPSGTAHIINKNNNSDGAEAYAFWYSGTTNKYYFTAYHSGSVYTTAVLTSTASSAGNLDHLVVTVDGSRNYKIYLNGTLEATQQLGTGTIRTNSHPVRIGSYGSNAHAYDGKLSVVRFYNTTLTASEVAQNYRAGNTFSYDSIYTTNLAMHLDAGDDTTVSASTWSDKANSNDVTLSGFSSTLSDFYDKELGNWLNFDGSDDTGDISHHSDLDLSTTFTIEAWVQRNDNTERYIFTKQGGSLSYGYALQFHPNSSFGYTFIVYNTANGIFQTAATVAKSGTAGDWQHVVGVIDGTNIILYINGEQVATQSYTGTLADSDSVNLFLGRYPAGATRWLGKIGQARIYQSSLSAKEVGQNYLVGKKNYPNGTNATINGATFSATTPAFFELDGSNDFIDTNFSNNKMEEFTISTFVRFADATPSGNKYFISDTSNGNEFTATFHLGMTASTGNWILFIGDGSSTQNGSSNVVATGISDNTWTHIVFTCDGINDTVKYYKNGSLSSTIFDGTASYIGSHSGAGTMKLGRFGGLSSFFTDMDFGQFKIFNKTLSASEVLAEYNANKATYGL